ncbi:hypothetical protein FKM82_016846 [Ascaphus truei]|uniref:olfactory receptor class A-like protein 1 n=1 Tax=Ascaphus truei TaxID=8439 RepID=UPI003F59AD1D
MDIHLLLKAIFFFFLAVMGIPGNILILLKLAYARAKEKKLLPTNVILMALASVNLLVVLSRVIPQALNAIGVKNLLDDDKCKLFLFTFRVSRAMSICLTSLHSCHQCIRLAPATSLWIYLKQRVTQNLLVIAIIILLSINSCLCSSFPLYAHAKKNSTTSPYTLHLVYCNTDFLTYISYIVNGTIYTVRDFLFVGLMILTSSYIVYVLLRHMKNIKGLRRSDRDKVKLVEYKASRAVILLVAQYVMFFSLDNSMWVYTLTLSNVSANLNDARIGLACSFSALSPVVIIATNPKLQWKGTFVLTRQRLIQTDQEESEKKQQVNCISR